MTLGDIKNKIYALTKTNSSTYPAADMLIDINIAYNRITSLIIQSDGRWQWDDDNQPATDQGSGVGGQQNGTTGLVTGQQDYSFPASYQKINRIEVKPNGGTYFYRIYPRDVDDKMWGSTLLGIDNLTQGAPMWYDVTAHSVFLYPIPNYTQAASLKFYFQRGQIDFTSGDLSTGTVVPGFASLFHDLIAYIVAVEYAIVNLPSAVNQYSAVVAKKETELKNYYAWRNHDDENMLKVRSIRFK